VSKKRENVLGLKCDGLTLKAQNGEGPGYRPIPLVSAEQTHGLIDLFPSRVLGLC